MTDHLTKTLAEALHRIADPRNIHFAGDAKVVARAALTKFEYSLREHAAQHAAGEQGARFACDNLPPLPEPEYTHEEHGINNGWRWASFSADQMRDYARAAQAAQPLPVRDEREAFEAWLDRPQLAERCDSGKYVNAHADAMWSAWQARSALPQSAPEAQQGDEARRQAQAEASMLKGKILKIATAVTNAGFTLVETEHGYQVRKFGPAVAQSESQQPAQGVATRQVVPLSPTVVTRLCNVYAPDERRAFARAIERACAEAWGVRLAGGGEGV